MMEVFVSGMQAAGPPGMKAGACACTAGRSSLPSTSPASSSSSLQGRRLALGSGALLSQGAGNVGRGRKGFQVRASEGDVPFLKKLGTQIVRSKQKLEGRSTERGRARPKGRKSKESRQQQQQEEEEESEDFSLEGLLKRISLAKRPPGPGSLSKGTLVVREAVAASLEFNFGRIRRTESRTIFVAGALGQIGARTTQKLLKSGFVVRAGVPDLRVAQQLAEFATQYGILTSEEARRLNAVEFDFRNVESVAKALGNAGKVVVTVGPAEDGPKGVVTADDALRVVEAASLANVGHFILVSDPSIGPKQDTGFFATLFNFLKRKQGKQSKLSVGELIDKIAATDLKYTVIKAAPTSVEELEAGDVEILAEGSPEATSVKVGKLQVAAAIESAFTNSTVSENKVVEVFASRSAREKKPLEDLFSTIPRDNRRQIFAEALAKVEAEESERQERLQAEAEARAASEAAKEAAQAAARLEAEARRLAQEEARASALAAKAQARAAAAAASLEDVTGKVKGLGGTISGASYGAKEPAFPSFFNLSKDGASFFNLSKDGAATSKPPPSSSPPPVAKDIKQLFGNLFNQETLFGDD